MPRRQGIAILIALCVFGTAFAAWAFVPKVLTIGTFTAPPSNNVTPPPPGPFTGPAGACKAGGTGQVVVTPATTCQTMDGFGAMAARSSTWQTQLWGTANLGYSIMRYSVPYYGTSNPCTIVQQSCVTGGNTDISYAQQVIAAAGPDLQTLWTVWHYPSNLGSTGDCPVDPAAAPGDATFSVNFLKSLQTYYSIVPTAFGVQNEPDDNFTCSSVMMPAAQMHTLIVNNIGPAFASNGITTKLLMPETFQTTDLGSWLSPTMNDSAAAAYVTYEASHQYDGSTTITITNPFISNGKHLWETETSGGNGFGPSLCSNGCWNPSIADGMMWAGFMDSWLAGANASGWLYWLADGCGNPPPDNECLASDDGSTLSKRGYIIGNYAKFIRPGWVMVSATHDPQSNVTVTAYRNPATKNYAIVAQNQGSSAVSQSFTASGATIASATPWVTSGSLNMAQQSSLTISGGAFSYSLPATSVTTFVGTIN